MEGNTGPTAEEIAEAKKLLVFAPLEERREVEIIDGAWGKFRIGDFHFDGDECTITE